MFDIFGETSFDTCGYIDVRNLCITSNVNVMLCDGLSYICVGMPSTYSMAYGVPSIFVIVLFDMYTRSMFLSILTMNRYTPDTFLTSFLNSSYAGGECLHFVGDTKSTNETPWTRLHSIGLPSIWMMRKSRATSCAILIY